MFHAVELPDNHILADQKEYRSHEGETNMDDGT